MGIIGERLKLLRERDNVTQKALAKYLNTTQQVYSRYETGSTQLPLHHLEKLAEYYNVSTDYILGRIPFQQIPPALSESFYGKISTGEFINYIQKFDKKSRFYLIEYAKYLHWLELQENDAKKRGKL